jgi:hypothetical protein
MDVRMPVEPSAIGIDRAEDPDIQPSGRGGILQIVDGQAAEGRVNDGYEKTVAIACQAA